MRNRHDFRNRLRHRHLKTLSTGSMAGFFPVLLMVFVGLWWDTHCTGYFCSREYNESRFVDVTQRVSEWIDGYRNEHGRLPDSLQIDWLIKSKWEENFYYDDEDYHRTEFFYRYWSDENAFRLVSLGGYRQYFSTPDSSWYIFSHWDIEADSIVSVRLSVDEAVRERLR